MPFFSIVLPTYNRASFLQRSISSVLNQTFTDFELIIIDDASTDNTKDVIETFNDERIRYFKNGKNRERSVSRNKGIELSRGKYICFLDSDDIYRPEHLSGFSDFIIKENQPKIFLYSGFQRNFISDESKIVLEQLTENDNVIEWLIQKQLPPPSTVCIHKDILLQFCFNPLLRINEDLELWVRIATTYQIKCIRQITVDFTIHGGNTCFNQKIPRQDEINVLKELCKNPITQKYISKSLKKKRLQELRSQQIIVLNAEKKDNLVPYIISYLLRYPFAFQNKHRLYVLLENLYLFKGLLKLYSAFKRCFRKSK